MFHDPVQNNFPQKPPRSLQLEVIYLLLIFPEHFAPFSENFFFFLVILKRHLFYALRYFYSIISTFHQNDKEEEEKLLYKLLS